MSEPAPPVPLPVANPASAPTRLRGGAPLEEAFLTRLRAACPQLATHGVDEAARDWWPLSLVWAEEGLITARPGAVVRPATVEQVAAVARACNDAGVPLTAAGGRSGVCGGTAPVFGGVLLDTRGLAGVRLVDPVSQQVEVGAGTFGPQLEDALAVHDLTVGHWPQSMEISTVGGWVACRGAGQYSTRYGAIEDMVAGLDVVLADGTLLRVDGSPRQAVGPDLRALFIGSEGTLGIIVGVRLRAHRRAPARRLAAYGFPDVEAGLAAMRRVVQRGATPAVLRLYDEVESRRTFAADGCVLLVLDEADPGLADAVMAVVAAECAGAARLDDALVEQWLAHRNDVSALEPLIRGGLVVDTMEVAGSWAALPGIYAAVVAAIGAVPGTLAVSAHQSHSYPDGGCLYFSFGGQVPAADREAYYRAVWDAGTEAALAAGATLSHHHGVGLNRDRFVPAALGAAFDVLLAVKQALDPRGILNPGKLGLPAPFGEVSWP